MFKLCRHKWVQDYHKEDAQYRYKSELSVCEHKHCVKCFLKKEKHYIKDFWSKKGYFYPRGSNLSIKEIQESYNVD